MEIESINGYEIAFPVNQESLQCAVAADGGTIAMWFEDAKGNAHHLYIDRRIRTETPDHLYSDAHPKTPGSRYLGFSPGVVRRLEEAMDSKYKHVEPDNAANGGQARRP